MSSTNARYLLASASVMISVAPESKANAEDFHPAAVSATRETPRVPKNRSPASPRLGGTGSTGSSLPRCWGRSRRPT